MTSRDFCYWLQGVFEVGQPERLNKEQLEIIQRHLALVFIHEIDPQAGGEAVQEKLNEAHGGSANPPDPKPPKGPKGGGGDDGSGSSNTVYRC